MDIVDITVPNVASEATVFKNKPISEFYAEVQAVYLEDTKPWVLGYSLSLIHISEPTRPY